MIEALVVPVIGPAGPIGTGWGDVALREVRVRPGASTHLEQPFADFTATAMRVQRREQASDDRADSAQETNSALRHEEAPEPNAFPAPTTYGP